jgi:putative membrane protein
MHGDGHGMGGWGYALMAVSVVLFLGLVITGIVVLVRYLHFGDQRASDTAQRHSGPEQILAERLARGETDEEEYRGRLDILRGGARS